uniref:ARAD1D07612p n=1 Tax=Blastobotrys adeninivorans TaxID=409370 RepID=A0A060T8J9_BLAAD
MWTTQRCTRALRPLKYQLKKCTEQDSQDELSTVSSKRLRTYKRKRAHYSAQLTVFESIVIQFERLLCDTCTDCGSLKARAALEIGRNIVRSEDDCVEHEWHDAINILGDRYRQFVLLGHAVELLNKHMEHILTICPLILDLCIKYEALLLGKLLLKSFVNVLHQVELWSRIEFIMDYSKSLQANHVIADLILQRLLESNCESHWSRVNEFLVKYRGTYSIETLEKLSIGLLDRASQHAPDCLGEFFLQTRYPSVHCVKMLRKHAQSSVPVCEILKIYENFRTNKGSTGNNTSNNEQEELFMTVYGKDRSLFMEIVDYLVGANPSFAVKLSLQFVQRSPSLDITLWQDRVETQAMENSGSNCSAFGVWVEDNDETEANIDINTDDENSECQIEYMSDTDMPNHDCPELQWSDDTLDDEDSLIPHKSLPLYDALPPKKRSFCIMESESDDEDDALIPQKHTPVPSITKSQKPFNLVNENIDYL